MLLGHFQALSTPYNYLCHICRTFQVNHDVQNIHSLCLTTGEGVQPEKHQSAHLQVKELAVASVDDLCAAIAPGHFDDIDLVKETRDKMSPAPSSSAKENILLVSFQSHIHVLHKTKLPKTFCLFTAAEEQQTERKRWQRWRGWKLPGGSLCLVD